MSKHEKNLQRLCSTPTPSDIRWEELVGVLKHLGYEQLTNSGSRRKFHHKKTGAVIICHQPHPSPNVDKGCVSYVVGHLKDYKLI